MTRGRGEGRSASPSARQWGIEDSPGRIPITWIATWSAMAAGFRETLWEAQSARKPRNAYVA